MSTIDQLKFERIENYLAGKLSSEELRKFESDLMTDAELKAELEIQKDLQMAIEMGGLKAELENIHEKIHPTSIDHKKLWIGIAAVLIIFMGLTYWFTSYQPKTQQLFAEYSSVDPGMPVPMSSTDKYAFYDAMVDYKTEKYDLAIEKWNRLLIEEPQNDTLLYFIASSHFNTQNYETALQFYTQMGIDAAPPYNDKAQWYTVLCDLKLDNRASVLSVIPHRNSPYTEQIKRIQTILKE